MFGSKFLCSFLLIIGSFSTVFGVSGWKLSIDLTKTSNEDSFSCMGQSADSMIIPTFLSDGSIDPNAGSNFVNAKLSDMEYIDLSLIPCINNVESQMDQFLNFLQENNFKSSINYVWLDVFYNQNDNCKWYDKEYQNCQILSQFIKVM